MRRAWLAVLMPCLMLLSACASLPKSPLSLEVGRSMKLESVSVTVAPDAHIWWGNAERAYLEKHGDAVIASLKEQKAAAGEDVPSGTAGIFEDAKRSPEVQEQIRNEAARRLQFGLKGFLQAEMNGAEPVRLNVVIDSVVVPSAVQRVVLGGAPTLTASATLERVSTGERIATMPKVTVVAYAGNGWGGVLVDQFLDDDHYDRLVLKYATMYRNWLLNT